MPIVYYSGLARDIEKYPPKQRREMEEDLSSALIILRGFNYRSAVLGGIMMLRIEDIEPMVDLLAEHKAYPNATRGQLESLVFDWVGLCTWKQRGDMTEEDYENIVNRIMTEKSTELSPDQREAFESEPERKKVE